LEDEEYISFVILDSMGVIGLGF